MIPARSTPPLPLPCADSEAPLVSILIPCFNAERWIAQCIESALRQTHSNKEVIVIDDGSSDCSLDVIRSFGDRIRWESGPNCGGNPTRNRLLELATGAWLQFLDADDYLLPDKIANQLNIVASACSTVDVVYSPVLTETWCDGDVVDTHANHIDASQSLEEQWIRWQVAQTGTVLWRADFLRSIGGWNEDYTCCQDNEATLRAILAAGRFAFCDSAQAVYRIWSEDTVCRRDPSQVIHVKTQLLDQMLDWLKATGRLDSAHTVAAGQAYFEMARKLAVADVQLADTYRQERLRTRVFRPCGPAAPWHYRLMYRTVGFRCTETVANFMRRL